MFSSRTLIKTRIYFIVFNVDFHYRHSLSAGVPGASSALFAPVGSPLDAFFPQESRTFRSNQMRRFLK